MTHLKYSLQKLALKTVFHPFFLTSIIVTKYPYTFSYVLFSKCYNNSCQLFPLHTNRKVQSFVLCVTAFAHYRTMKYLQREG